MEHKTSKEGQQQRFRSEKDFSTIDPTFNMIRVIVNDFGDQCSLHGIYALFSKRSIFAKLLWAVAILFMNGLFFFYLLDLMEDAVLKSPAATTTSLSYEQVLKNIIHSNVAANNIFFLSSSFMAPATSRLLQEHFIKISHR